MLKAAVTVRASIRRCVQAATIVPGDFQKSDAPVGTNAGALYSYDLFKEFGSASAADGVTGIKTHG